MSSWYDTLDAAEGLRECAASVIQSVEDEDILAALRAVNRANLLLVHVASAVVEIAGRETRIPQRALADALGVPARTFSGLRS